MWLTSIIISACVLLVSLLFAVFVNRRKNAADNETGKWRGVKVLYILAAGVLLGAAVMFYPMHFFADGVEQLSGVRALLLSLFNAIQIFMSGCEFEVVQTGLAHCPSHLNLAYGVWAAALFVFAPILTFGFVLSLIKNLFAGVRYAMAYRKDVYVFSELNEKSLVLAKSIREKHKKAVIVFTDVFDEEKERTFELREKAQRLHAICFKNDLLAVNFGFHAKRARICFFAIGEDETENLDQSLKLIETYKMREGTELYVFSTKIQCEILLSSADKGRMTVRRVHEVQSLIYDILYQSGLGIFEKASPDESGTKEISALVVGMGLHGSEMLKALTWFCQMDGYRLQIHAFDKDPLAEARFIAQAPELMDDAHNGSTVAGEAQYRIKIHSGMDAEAKPFLDEIAKIRRVTYVLVALGNDDRNIRTAIALRTHFERLHVHPKIQAIVYNSRQKEALAGIANFKGTAYDIEFIGDLSSSYNAEVVMDSKLQKLALARHLSYVNVMIDGKSYDKDAIDARLSELGITEERLKTLNGSETERKKLTEAQRALAEALQPYWTEKEASEQDFWRYEYHYKSSVASALHIRLRVLLDLPGAKKQVKDRTEEERELLESLEHRRWNAYMRAEGYVFSGSEDPATRNDLAKMHHNLVPFDQLPSAVRKLDSVDGAQE